MPTPGEVRPGSSVELGIEIGNLGATAYTPIELEVISTLTNPRVFGSGGRLTRTSRVSAPESGATVRTNHRYEIPADWIPGGVTVVTEIRPLWPRGGEQDEPAGNNTLSVRDYISLVPGLWPDLAITKAHARPAGPPSGAASWTSGLEFSVFNVGERNFVGAYYVDVLDPTGRVIHHEMNIDLTRGRAKIVRVNMTNPASGAEYCARVYQDPEFVERGDRNPGNNRFCYTYRYRQAPRIETRPKGLSQVIQPQLLLEEKGKDKK